MSAALLAKLIEAGTPVELVGEVAMELARAKAIEELVERRKAKDRERKRAPRISEESTEIVECAEIHDKGSLEVPPPAPPPPKPSKISPLSPPKSKGVETPDWMPAEPWAAFKEMRRKMRGVPFTEAAERGIISDVQKAMAEGHCPTKLLMKAVKNGHRGVFPDETTRARKAGGKIEMSAQQLREKAEWFVRHGMQDRADDCRRKAVSIEQRMTA